MKKTIFNLTKIGVAISAISLLLASCDGLLPQKITNDEEEYDFEETIEDDTDEVVENEDEQRLTFRLDVHSYTNYNELEGLLVYVGGYSVLFNDERNYDDVAPIFLMAYLVAKKCVSKGYSAETIEQYLPYVINLPITDEFDDDNLKEIFNATYYDNKNKEIYAAEERYGYREYPYGDRTYNGGRNSVIIERVSKNCRYNKECGINPNTIYITGGYY